MSTKVKTPTQGTLNRGDRTIPGTTKVAAIVPAYNEEETIGDVVRVLAACPLLDEVIVVSDGSTDGTAEEARRAGARVIELPVNQGKGAAMKVGVENCDCDVIVFLDADLIGLTSAHVESLVNPVVEGDAGMTVGLFDGGRIATDLAQVVAPYLSGQRAVRREVLAHIPEMESTGFGVEVALTRHIKKTGTPVREVVLENLTQRMKEEKRGLVKGLAARVKMYWEIVRAAQRR